MRLNTPSQEITLYLQSNRAIGSYNLQLNKLSLTGGASWIQFLTVLGNEYSISLFHYRNHGAAFGRILVGMQVPEGKRAGLRKALNRLGYRFWEETDDPAYREYLCRGRQQGRGPA